MDKLLKKQLKEVLREKDPLKKSLTFIAILNEKLRPKGVKPILVGGRALEFYTLGGYATKDIDLVIEGVNEAKAVLIDMGFSRNTGERHWFNEELDIAVEIPDNLLAGAPEKIVTVEINGSEVYIIGVEDLIIDRLAAAKFWNSESDAVWAAKLLALHAEEIDTKYLQEVAKKEQVVDTLQKAFQAGREYLAILDRR